MKRSHLRDILWASLVFLCVSPWIGAHAETVISSEYFPLADNNSWTYSIDGLFTVTETVLPGTTLINGVPTKALQEPDGGINYFTSDTNGIRYHREFDPSPPAGTVTLSPPIMYMRGVSPVPDVINNAGTASVSFPDLSSLPFVFSYAATVEVVGFEAITVPAGTFYTLKVRYTLRIFGTSQGVPLDETFIETDWYARNIGLVKAVLTDSDGTQTAVLTSTNVMLPLSTTRYDFNGDGMSDIFWRYVVDGRNAQWQMNSFTPVASSFLPSVPVSWAAAGVCDFDGDQMADILWRDDTGQNAIWLMNGDTPRLARLIPAVGTTWNVAGVGDFNADDHCDILWRNADGSNAQWQMNGVTPVATRLIDPVSTSWSVEAVDDFNGDDYVDILWRDNVGQNAIWLMKGFSTLQASLIPPVLTDWGVAGTGDFDGDTNSDILWRDVTGRNALWLMEGVFQKAAKLISPVSIDWTVVATGDYNGDRLMDILWRDDGGQNAIWLMNGFTTEAARLIPPLLDTTWEVQ